ncbi:hypothetical protein LSAT2_028252 [Lamellibrachia satsuma]|nr:hypothetical protein LSAT2_028252 [Lamellibrachia satsuma]
MLLMCIYFEGAIDSLTLASNYSTVGDNESKRLFEFEEGENTYIACHSRGGNPTPTLRIFRDEFDITHEFTSSVAESTSGQPGLQVVNYEVSLVKTDFLASLDQVGQNLKCHARVRRRPEFKRTATAVIDVKYAPHFHCANQRTVFPEARNYEVDCVVQSNPTLQLDSIYWSVGDNATVNISLGQTVAGLMANATVESTYRLRAVLTIAEVNLTSLQTYRLVARNSLGERRYEIVLSEGKLTELRDSAQ